MHFTFQMLKFLGFKKFIQLSTVKFYFRVTPAWGDPTLWVLIFYVKLFKVSILWYNNYNSYRILAFLLYGIITIQKARKLNAIQSLNTLIDRAQTLQYDT